MSDKPVRSGRRRKFIKGAGAAMVTALAGCGGGDTTTEGEGSGSTPTETNEGTTTGTASQNVTTLSLRMFANSAKEKFINDHNPKMREEIGVEVDYETMGWSNAKKVQNNSITSGSGPDVEEIASTWMPKQINSNGWMDMGEAGVDLPEDKIYDSPMEIGKFDGVTAGFPWFWGPRAHLYYDGMMESAGIDGAPSTWDEMIEDAKTFNGWAEKQASSGFQQKSLFGIPGANNWAVTQYYMMLLWQNGGQMLDDNNKAVFNSDKAVQAMNFYKDLAGANNISPRSSIEWNGTARNNAFISKQIASTWAGITMKSNISNPQKNLTAGAPPAGPNGDPSTFFGVNLIGIHPWTDKQRAAAKFVEYLTRADVNADLAKRRGFLPSVKESFQAPAIQNNSLFQEFNTLLEDTNAKTAPQVVGWGGVANSLKGAIVDILTKESTGNWSQGDTKKRLDAAVTQANDAL